MTNTESKGRKMPRRIAGKNSVARSLAFPAPLFGGPWKSGLQQADSVPCARRTLVLYHHDGSDGFLVHNDPPADPQNYPEAGVWRKLSRTTHSLAPGCMLEARIIAARSGMTEHFVIAEGAWSEYGVNGRLRIVVDFNNGSDTDTATAEVSLDPSPNEYGAEPTTPGGSWGHLLFRYVELIAPAGVKAGTLAEIAKWSENTSVTISIEVQGGARIIQCAVSEKPHEYAIAHDEETETSLHPWASDLQPPARPQTEVADGADFEEHRLGTTRGRVVAARQSARLGPMIASATSHSESTAEVTDTDPDPWETSSSSFAGMSLGSSYTAWSANAPGYPVFCYAPPAPWNLSTRLKNSAVIPVRLRLHCRFTGAGTEIATVRFQSSSRSWIDWTLQQADIGSAWTDVETTGFLESGVAPNDKTVNLMDFFKVSGGATFQARYWSVEFGWG